MRNELLWVRCDIRMQNKNCARTVDERLIYKNPIEMLKPVKEHAMDYEETYPKFLSFQTQNKHLQDHPIKVEKCSNIAADRFYIYVICKNADQSRGHLIERNLVQKSL